MVNTNHNQSSSTHLLPKINERGQVYYPLSTDQPIFMGHDLNNQIVLAPASYEGFSQLYIEVLPPSLKAPAQKSDWQVSDLGSGKAIEINRQRLRGCQPLQLGDEIWLGQNEPIFIFEALADHLFSLRVTPSEVTATHPNNRLSQSDSAEEYSRSHLTPSETETRSRPAIPSRPKQPFDLKGLFPFNLNLPKIPLWQIVAAIALLGGITVVSTYQSTPPVTLPPIPNPTSNVPGSAPAPTNPTVEAQNLMGQWRFEGDSATQGAQFHKITTLILRGDKQYSQQDIYQFAFGGQTVTNIVGTWDSPTQGTLVLHLVDYAPKLANLDRYNPNNEGEPTWIRNRQRIPPPYQDATLEYGVLADGQIHIWTPACRPNNVQAGSCGIFNRM